MSQPTTTTSRLPLWTLGDHDRLVMLLKASGYDAAASDTVDIKRHAMPHQVWRAWGVA